jgi:hypothetical protein
MYIYLKQNHMKRYCALLFSIVVLSFTSCGSDDDEKPSYEFKDQDAIGKIENEEFIYDDGYADYIDEPEMRITITEAQTGDICTEMPEGNTVSFYVASSEGLTKLGNDHTITFFQPIGSHNIIATEGAVEIIEITDTHVSGRIDARFDNETYINGNFTVTRCPQ